MSTQQLTRASFIGATPCHPRCQREIATRYHGGAGADDVMLNDQSASFHDALYICEVFGLRRALEFDDWLFRAGLVDAGFSLVGSGDLLPDFAMRLMA